MIQVVDGEMVCEPQLQFGELKGRTATGTPTGYRRHYRAGEKPCEACRTAYNTRQAETRKPRKRVYVRRADKRKPRPEQPGANLPRPRSSEPAFTGFALVRCACGARGKVNKGLLKRGQKKIESCVECR